MRTHAGTECKYYYEDFHRRSYQECRLIARNPESRTWSPDLCGRCPVPRILQANQCPHLLLKASAVRRLLLLWNVEVDAYCEAQRVSVAEPMVGCGHCVRQNPAAGSQ